jgi:PPOX class probable F420-dependent enzyme
MARKLQPIPAKVRTKLREARVARLATLDAKGGPHIVPVCFVYHNKVFYTAIDLKPKRVAPQRLARLKHIQAVPQVALLVDHYDDDWSQLWYVLVRGKARVMPHSATRERTEVVGRLRAKYSQYAAGMLADDALLIRIIPQRTTCWGNF